MSHLLSIHRVPLVFFFGRAKHWQSQWHPGMVCVLLAACLASVHSSAQADVTYTELEDDLTVIRMTVTPAAAPVPAFKHRFVTPDIDLKPGNAAPSYYRALMDIPRVMKHLRSEYDEDDELSRWYGTGADATPIAKLPLEKVRAASASIDGLVRGYLGEAVLRRDCDWHMGIEEIRGPDVVAFLLPEVQQSRQLARMLALRTRLAIAEKRYDAAIETMRMNYRLAVDTGKAPLFISGLVGIAEAGLSNAMMIELMAEPDSPNMYWALSELPQPMIDLRPAMRFEMGFGPRIFPLIHQAETTDRSPDEWNRLFTQALRDFSTLGGGVLTESGDEGVGIMATGLALLGYSHAKQQLIAQGMDRQHVEQMAVGQVIAIYSERNYQRLADEYEKLWYVPFWEMGPLEESAEQQLQRANLFSGDPNREVLPIVSLLLPATHVVRHAEVRLDRNIAALRVIEALRMYAASHAGRLPKSLDQITQVPVPLNPATGQPFAYRLDGQTAVLDLPPSDGVRNYNRRFEIAIVKQ